MEVLQSHMGRKIAICKSIPRAKIKEKIATAYGQSKEAVKHSDKPLDIPTEFRKFCINIDREYKIGAFK